MEYSIDYGELTRLQEAYARAPQIVHEELMRAVTEADLLILHEVSDQMPIGAQGFLRQSLFNEEHIAGLGVEGLVATPMSYAVAVELGTKPHFPPLLPLQEWAQHKLGIPEKEARGVAFAIARKIALHGTKAQLPFRHAFDATQSQVHEMFDRAVERIGARLGEG